MPFSIEALIPAVLAAGAATLRHRASGVVREEKADHSPVTAADREAEGIILAALAEIAPGVPVVAEEEVAAGKLPQRSDRFFLVDALDGTREYVSGGDDFTVNVALVEHGAPVAGIVHAPADGRLFWGEDGQAFRSTALGGQWDGSRETLECVSCDKPRRAVASKSHCTPGVDAYLARCGSPERLSIGSSLKFALVAAGEADIYPREGPTSEWDTAAGDAVLRAAGGMTYGPDGAPFRYGKPDYRNGPFVAAGGFVPPPIGERTCTR